MSSKPQDLGRRTILGIRHEMFGQARRHKGNSRMLKYPNRHGRYVTLLLCHAVEDDAVISKDGEVTAQPCKAARLSSFKPSKTIFKIGIETTTSNWTLL